MISPRRLGNPPSDELALDRAGRVTLLGAHESRSSPPSYVRIERELLHERGLPTKPSKGEHAPLSNVGILVMRERVLEVRACGSALQFEKHLGRRFSQLYVRV